MSDLAFANPLFVALDMTDADAAEACGRALKATVGGLKLGLEFFLANGPDGVRALGRCDLPLFLDLKLHDIPNTVAGALNALAPLAPTLVTLHAQGGAEMMRRAAHTARAAAAAHKVPPPKRRARTGRTSLDGDDLKAMGGDGDVAAQTERLARLAQEAGLDGVVASPREVARLRQILGPDMLLVVPGVRPQGAPHGDQKRVMTPRQALDAGADVLVIGRPITQAPDPAAAARAIAASLV
jgi:orotidine-5'-phosphate decarboxylase